MPLRLSDLFPPDAPRPPPGDVVAVVARNLPPVIGVALLGWSAPNLLMLYFIDTWLGLAAVVLMVMAHVTGSDGKPARRGRPVRPPQGPAAWAKALVASLLGATLIALPLGVPVFFLVAAFGWNLAEALRDPGFQFGIALQVVFSAHALVQAHHDLLRRDDDETVLKQRTQFIFARWVVLLVAATTGLLAVLGPRLGGGLMVLLYAAASIYFELFPERADAMLHGRWSQSAHAATRQSADRNKKRAAPRRP